MAKRLWFDPWRSAWLFALCAAVVVYLPAMSGMLIWDDHALVGGSGIGGGKHFLDCFTQPFLAYYYRPMVSASFYLDHLVFRTTPFGFHQTNVLLHVATTAVVIALLSQAFHKRSVAAIGGILFALQPAQVSTVAWIGGRTDSLAALFVAVFAWALIAGCQVTGRRRIVRLAVAVLAYVAAIFTKEQTLALLPLVPLAFHLFADPAQEQLSPEHRASRRRALFWTTAACAASSALFVGLWMLLGPPRPALVDPHPADLLTQGARTSAYYALLLLCPTPQTMHTLCLGNMERLGVLSILAGLAVVAGCVWLLARWRRTQPGAAWFMAFILLTVLPVSNFMPLPSLLVAPYRVGVTGIGIAALLGWGVARITIRRPTGVPALSLLHPITAALVVWYGALCWWGASQWKDERTIFTTIVRYDPTSMIARLNLTSALLSHGQSQPAIGHLEWMLTRLFGSQAWRTPEAARTALATDPRITARVRENQGSRDRPEEWLAATAAQLGFARLRAGDPSGAVTAFDVGRAIDPGSDQVNLGLGTCALHRGDFRTAVGYLRVAASASDAIEAHARLGTAYAALRRWREARDEFAVCIREQPWTGQAYLDMADAQRHLGDRAGAERTLRDALARSPRRDDIRRMLTKL